MTINFSAFSSELEKIAVSSGLAGRAAGTRLARLHDSIKMDDIPGMKKGFKMVEGHSGRAVRKGGKSWSDFHEYQSGKDDAYAKARKTYDYSKTAAGFFKSPKADLAGLGLLGVPVAAKLVDRNASKKEKALAGIEGAGLGTLAAHVAANMRKKAAAIPAAHMKMMQQHAASDAYKAKGQSTSATPALRGQSQTFEPHQLGGGGHSAPLELASKSKAMAKKVAPTMPSRPVMNAARPAAQAAGGVMSRIGKVFGRG